MNMRESDDGRDTAEAVQRWAQAAIKTGQSEDRRTSRRRFLTAMSVGSAAAYFLSIGNMLNNNHEAGKEAKITYPPPKPGKFMDAKGLVDGKINLEFKTVNIRELREAQEIVAQQNNYEEERKRLIDNKNRTWMKLSYSAIGTGVTSIILSSLPHVMKRLRS